MPRWDGIYIVDKNDNYVELKFLTKASTRREKSRLTGSDYLSIHLTPDEINYINFDNFKGFYFKGSRIIEQIYINRMTLRENILSGALAFLSGMPGGQNFVIDANEIDKNLYTTEIRCITESNSQYCEFINLEKIKSYLFRKPEKKDCLLIMTGTSPERGGKVSALCFR